MNIGLGVVGLSWIAWLLYDGWRWSRAFRRRQKAIAEAMALIPTDPLTAARTLQKLYANDPVLCGMYGGLVARLENQDDTWLH